MKILSAEQVNMTPSMIKKVVTAMEEGKSLKLRFNKNNLVGNYPIYIDQMNKKKMDKAKTIGKGCDCEIFVDGLKKMHKKASGMYMFGQGMQMFGSHVPQNKNKIPPTQIIKTGTGINEAIPLKTPYPLTFHINEANFKPNESVKRTVGGSVMQSYGAIPYKNNYK